MVKIKKYLLVTFLVAWLLQFCAIAAFINGDNMLYQTSLMIMMFAPLLGTFFSTRSLAGLGWKPDFKGKVKYFFIAWLAPGVMAILGAALYFLIFRNAFDNSGRYLLSTVGEAGMAELENAGLTPMSYNMMTIVSGLTYAPLLNMFLAVGEEVGWRGYMNPILKKKYGVLQGRLISGAIWGVWHWPVMIIGYEYGISYPGYPFLGPIIFCLYAIAAGIFLDWLYENTHIIWAPALAHGAINASTFGLLFLNPDYSNLMILGPVPIGIISMIPLIIVALLICKKDIKSAP